VGFDKDETIATFSYLLRQLNNLKIAFVDFARYLPSNDQQKRGTPLNHLEFKQFFTNGVWLLNGGFDGISGEQILEQGEADGIVYARHFIANPDLPYRLKHNIPLSKPNPVQFYWDMKSPIENGYSDYPFANGNTQQKLDKQQRQQAQSSQRQRSQL